MRKVKEQYAAYQANPEGYFDSVELMELDTMVGGKGKNNPTLVKVLAEQSGSAIDYLEKLLALWSSKVYEREKLPQQRNFYKNNIMFL